MSIQFQYIQEENNFRVDCQQYYLNFHLGFSCGTLAGDNDSNKMNMGHLEIKSSPHILAKNTKIIKLQTAYQGFVIDCLDPLSAIAEQNMLGLHYLNNVSLEQTLKIIFNQYPIVIAEQEFLQKTMVKQFQLCAEQTIATTLCRLEQMLGCVFMLNRGGELMVLTQKMQKEIQNFQDIFQKFTEPQKFYCYETEPLPYIHATSLNHQGDWQPKLSANKKLGNGLKRIFTQGEVPFNAVKYYQFLHPSKYYELEYNGIVPFLPGDIIDVSTKSPEGSKGNATPKMIIESHFYKTTTTSTTSKFVAIEYKDVQSLIPLH